MLPDRSVLTGQKLVENAKILKFKWDILSNFQIMWWEHNEVFLKEKHSVPTPFSSYFMNEAQSLGGDGINSALFYGIRKKQIVFLSKK